MSSLLIISCSDYQFRGRRGPAVSSEVLVSFAVEKVAHYAVLLLALVLGSVSSLAQAKAKSSGFFPYFMGETETPLSASCVKGLETFLGLILGSHSRA